MIQSPSFLNRMLYFPQTPAASQTQLLYLPVLFPLLALLLFETRVLGFFPSPPFPFSARSPAPPPRRCDFPTRASSRFASLTLQPIGLARHAIVHRKRLGVEALLEFPRVQLRKSPPRFARGPPARPLLRERAPPHAHWLLVFDSHQPSPLSLSPTARWPAPDSQRDRRLSASRTRHAREPLRAPLTQRAQPQRREWHGE